MHLIKEVKTSSMRIEIYSLNPDLSVDVDASLFEGKDDQAIQDLVFNQIGAEEVRIYEEGRENPIIYAIA